jgi:hypothetical protein
MPFLSESSTHFRSVNETIKGVLLSDFCALSCASNGAQAQATATAMKNTFIQSFLIYFSLARNYREFLSASNDCSPKLCLAYFGFHLSASPNKRNAWILCYQIAGKQTNQKSNLPDQSEPSSEGEREPDND